MPSNNINPNLEDYPQTVGEIVEELLETITEENKTKIRHMKKTDLIDLHFGLGSSIRNHFGLWKRSIFADSASMTFLEAL